MPSPSPSPTPISSNDSGSNDPVPNNPPTPDNRIPTPALLPGLIGMGVQMMRKRRQEEVEAASNAEGDEEI
ncbi:PTPA-CTERM sorting domain-containing protein [Thermoleptolyngbya sp.]